MSQASLAFAAASHITCIASRCLKKISIGIALAAGLISPSVAQDLILTPGQNPNRSYINQTGFEQIDTYTRALRLSFVDVHLPGNGGFDLKLHRNYDSRGKDNNQSRPFTNGWSMHMGYISFSSGGGGSLCVNSGVNIYATLHTPQGETAQVLAAESIGLPSMFSNRWKIDCGRSGAGKIVVLDTEGTAYEMTLISWAGGQSDYTFRTTIITDRNGNWASVAYEPAYTYSQYVHPTISSITTNDGRTVNFSYVTVTYGCSDNSATGCNQRLASITAAGQTYSYQYCQPHYQSLSNQLVAVTRPDGAKWRFGYHGGPAEFCTVRQLNDYESYSPAERSGLTKVVSPFGGETNYTFAANWDFLDFGGQGLNYWQISSKSTNGANAGYWTFSSALGSHNGIPAAVTTVSGPEGATIYKYGMHNTTSFWQHGLLLMKQSGSTQTDYYTYASQKISSNPQRGITWGQEWYDYSGNHLPLLTNKTIIRDGATYATTYANHDAWGNPQTITESGPNGGYRQTARSYYVDTAKWIIHKPKDESFPGSSLLFSYDANANLLWQNVNGIVTSHGYDAQGNVSSTVFPGNKVHAYSNYYRGIARTDNQPEGINLYRAVSDAGNITSETNGEGHTTYYFYDNLNRVTGIQRPLGAAIGISYTANSRTAVRGGLVDYSQYDGFGRMTYQSVGGVTKHYTYDAVGRLTYQSNPGTPGVGTGFAYDILGRKTAIAHPGGSTEAIGYGPGYLVEYNERGTYTVRYFKAYGNPDSRFDYYIAPPIAASAISIARNAVDQITAVWQDGLARSYGYNSAYQLTSLFDPEVGTTWYGRDAAGNMIYKQTAGGVTY